MICFQKLEIQDTLIKELSYVSVVVNLLYQEAHVRYSVITVKMSMSERKPESVISRMVENRPQLKIGSMSMARKYMYQLESIIIQEKIMVTTRMELVLTGLLKL
nr:MAG TPA: Tetracycline resistance leader peptide [Herelleviridae sp.]